MSQVLRALEAKRLVTRAADPDDSRARRVGVTTRGAALAQRAIAVVEAADREFFAAASNQPALLKALLRLAA
ncbi:MAG: winged helix DNA-binding protein [Candidatus Dormibacteraeota bacterium]|nr:winged helix DNA-binding protein [Candidatus Dormibacteraeota bacterium]